MWEWQAEVEISSRGDRHLETARMQRPDEALAEGFAITLQKVK